MFTNDMEVLLAAYLGFEGLSLWKLAPLISRENAYSSLGLQERGMRRWLARLLYGAYARSHRCASFAIARSPILIPFVLTCALIDKPFTNGAAVFLTLLVIWAKTVAMGACLFCAWRIRRHAVGEVPSPVTIPEYAPVQESAPSPEEQETPERENGTDSPEA